MSSSRILSSRPSASCITAKPIARTIKGRGRNASPFFSAQKQGKLSGLFHQRMPGHCFVALRSGNRTAHRWGTVGVMGTSAPPHRKWGSRAGFSARAAGVTCFMALRPGNRTVHRWGTVGLWTLPHRPAGSRKAEGAFPSAPDGTMLHGSQSRKSHSPLPGYSGALALPHYPAGSRKAERAFPQSRWGH